MSEKHWLERFLEEYGLTRYRLEKDLGLSQGTTHSIIANNTPFDKIHLKTAQLLAKAAGLTLDQLKEKYGK